MKERSRPESGAKPSYRDIIEQKVAAAHKARMLPFETAIAEEADMLKQEFMDTVIGILGEETSVSFSIVQKPTGKDFPKSAKVWPYFADWEGEISVKVIKEDETLSVKAGVPGMWAEFKLDSEKPLFYESHTKAKCIRPAIRYESTTPFGRRGLFQFGSDLAKFVASYKPQSTQDQT